MLGKCRLKVNGQVAPTVHYTHPIIAMSVLTLCGVVKGEVDFIEPIREVGYTVSVDCRLCVTAFHRVTDTPNESSAPKKPAIAAWKYIDAYIDNSRSIDAVLNVYGKEGWEAYSVAQEHDGYRVFLKKLGEV